VVTELPLINVIILFFLIKMVDVLPIVYDLRVEVFAVILDACDKLILDSFNSYASLQRQRILACYSSTALELVCAHLELKMVVHLIIVRFDYAW